MNDCSRCSDCAFFDGFRHRCRIRPNAGHIEPERRACLCFVDADEVVD